MTRIDSREEEVRWRSVCEGAPVEGGVGEGKGSLEGGAKGGGGGGSLEGVSRGGEDQEGAGVFD